MTASAWRLSAIALIAAGALAAHDLRYLLAYGDQSEHSALMEGHSFLAFVTAVATAVLVVAVATLIARAATGAREGIAPSVPGPRAMWACATVALLVIFAFQESLEGGLALGHTRGLDGAFGDGGWLAVPLAAAVGVPIAFALRGGLRRSLTLRQLHTYSTRRLSRLRLGRRLHRMTSMEDFDAFVRSTTPEQFARYRGLSDEKRVDFESVLSHVDIDLRGACILDIGPGYGDSLDLAHERGARCAEFVEVDPVFYTYNRLKGFSQGYHGDQRLGLWRLPAARYDLVWLKGAVGADSFVSSKFNVGNIWLSRWHKQLERLASADSHIVLCPYWTTVGGRREVKDVHNHPFTRTAVGRGFVILPWIEGHNSEPAYPITLYKRMLGSS